MRGRAYRRHQAKSHYLTRVHNLFRTYGGYIVTDDGKIVRRCESFKDYMENVNPYILKTQGNFERHSDIYKKLDKRKQKAKERSKIKKEINECD